MPMTRATTDAVAFALSAGVPTDVEDALFIDLEPVGPGGGRRLLVTVEPLEQSRRGAEIAASALATLREAFADAAALPVSVALARAFAAANAAVREENRLQVREGRGLRVDVGATAVVLEGRELTIAQVPPTQAVVVQDAQVYAFPCLDSWGPDYLPTIDRPTPPAEPLGYADRICPDLYRTVMAPGDLVLLCSTGLARCLAEEGMDTSAETRVAAPPLGTDADEVMEQLERLVEEYDLDRAHAACLTVGHVPGTDLRLPAHTMTRIGEAWSVVTSRGRLVSGNVLPGKLRRPAAWASLAAPFTRPTSRSVFAPGNDGDDAGGSPFGPLLPRDADPAPPFPDPDRPVTQAPRSEPVVPMPAPVSGGSGAAMPEVMPAGVPPSAPDDLDAGWPLPPNEVQGEGLTALALTLPPTLSDGLAVGPHVRRSQILASAQTATVRLLERIAPKQPAAPPHGAARAALVPGALGMRCYRGTASLSDPPAWRLNLPRGPVIHVPRRLQVAVLVLLIVVAGSGIAYERHQARVAQISAAFATTDEALRFAATGADVAAVRAQLDAAQDALDDAANLGAPVNEITQREAGLADARDRADGIIRLAEVTRLGALPTEMAGRSVRLIRGDREIFVVGGGFYRLTPSGDRLVQLLAPGAKVGNTTVGDLHDGAWDATGATVTDGGHLYAMDVTGTWKRRPMGWPRGDSAWGAGPSGAFEGSFYLLDRRAGQILKFAGSEGTKPEEWIEPGFHLDLMTARDLAVDGRIHVLLADGRVLSFYRGELEATLTPGVTPPLRQPVALYGGPDTQALYIVDGGGEGGGRIIQVRRDGDGIRQLLLPSSPAGAPGTNPLADVQDLVVDEANRTLYFVTGDALWRTTLPEEATGA